MNKQELKLINDSIEAYENTIKFIRTQILELHRKKNAIVTGECKQCFEYEFKIAPCEDDYCEACQCTPCDCDFGEADRYIKNE